MRQSYVFNMEVPLFSLSEEPKGDHYTVSVVSRVLETQCLVQFDDSKSNIRGYCPYIALFLSE